MKIRANNRIRAGFKFKSRETDNIYEVESISTDGTVFVTRNNSSRCSININVLQESLLSKYYKKVI